MNQFLHILVVTRGLPFHSLGGMEAVAWDLSREFVKLGHQVTVLTTACDSLQEKQTIEGVNIHCLNAPQGMYSKAWWNESARVFKEQYIQKVNVVLSVSAGAMSIIQHKSPSIAYIVQAHGTSWGEFLSKIKQRNLLSWLKSAKNLLGFLKDFQYKKFDAFVAIGKAVEHDLKKLPTKLIVADLPVYLIPNGVNVDTFSFDQKAREQIRSKLKIEPHHKVIISACRLHEQKGILEALEGFALACKTDENLRFIIAGSGPEEGNLKQRVGTLGLQDKVYFVGSIARDQLKSYLSASDIFLFSTKRVEGLPMNILEALASGLRVIVSEHINDKSFNAIGINPESPTQISQAIISTTEFQDRSSKLAEQYTLTYCADSYIKAFLSLLKNNSDLGK